MTNKFQFVVRARDQVYSNLFGAINQGIQSGRVMEVVVKDYKHQRSNAQNRVFHMWRTDVANATGEDHNGGRLKLQYFVPILLAEDEKWAWVWKQTGAKLGYEQQCSFLGEPNVLGCTSRCNTDQFARALDALWAGEAHLGLRDPASCGIEWR